MNTWLVERRNAHTKFYSSEEKSFPLLRASETKKKIEKKAKRKLKSYKHAQTTEMVVAGRGDVVARPQPPLVHLHFIFNSAIKKREN